MHGNPLPSEASHVEPLPSPIALRQLKESGLRPTRQRVPWPIAARNRPRHVTAEELFQEARAAGIPVSLATVYNTLHQFTAAGLMTEVVAGSGQSYFDTNPDLALPLFRQVDGRDHRRARGRDRASPRLPEPPPGKVIDRIDVVVRIRSARRARARPGPDA